MYTLDTLLLTALLALALGGLLGALGSRWLPRSGNRQALKAEVDTLRQHHQDYQRAVNEHFEETAQLLRQLAGSYQAVQEQLQQGAERLCDAPLTTTNRPLSRTGTLSLEQEAFDSDNLPIPPRDYAPRSKNGTGVLAEEFGLEKNLEDEPTPPRVL